MSAIVFHKNLCIGIFVQLCDLYRTRSYCLTDDCALYYRKWRRPDSGTSPDLWRLTLDGKKNMNTNWLRPWPTWGLRMRSRSRFTRTTWRAPMAPEYEHTHTHTQNYRCVFFNQKRSSSDVFWHRSSKMGLKSELCMSSHSNWKAPKNLVRWSYQTLKQQQKVITHMLFCCFFSMLANQFKSSSSCIV